MSVKVRLHFRISPCDFGLRCGKLELRIAFPLSLIRTYMRFRKKWFSNTTYINTLISIQNIFVSKQADVTSESKKI